MIPFDLPAAVVDNENSAAVAMATVQCTAQSKNDFFISFIRVDLRGPRIMRRPDKKRLSRILIRLFLSFSVSPMTENSRCSL